MPAQATPPFPPCPVIAEVAKREGIRPSRPLSTATVASQIAITASPIPAAVVLFSGELEKGGVDYVQLLMIAIPVTQRLAEVRGFELRRAKNLVEATQNAGIFVPMSMSNRHR